MEKINNVADRKASETASAPKGQQPEQKPAAPAAKMLVTNMAAILSTVKSRTGAGDGKVQIRSNVGYTIVPENLVNLANENCPPQEQLILNILASVLTEEKPVISEPELNKLVVAAHAAGKLKTKQDPWHIFRYYRTDLEKKKILKQVPLAVAGEIAAAATAPTPAPTPAQ